MKKHLFVAAALALLAAATPASAQFYIGFGCAKGGGYGYPVAGGGFPIAGGGFPVASGFPVAAGFPVASGFPVAAGFPLASYPVYAGVQNNTMTPITGAPTPTPASPLSSGTSGGPGSGSTSGPGTTATASDPLIQAIKELTKEVKEFKEAYKKVHNIARNESPERKAVDEALVRLKADEGVRMASDDSRSAIDRQIALLKQDKPATKAAVNGLAAR
jgi:hypothetical protein